MNPSCLSSSKFVNVYSIENTKKLDSNKVNKHRTMGKTKQSKTKRVKTELSHTSWINGEKKRDFLPSTPSR